MSKYYKKLLFLVIPLSVGFCLALALGSAEQPSWLTQEENNKKIAERALNALSALELDLSDFDLNYIHHLPNPLGIVSIDLTLAETITWFFRFDESLNDIHQYIHIGDIITEENKVVVRFQRMNLSDDHSPSPYPIPIHLLSSEIWTWLIVDGKIVEGWSVSDDAPHEENNKALVKEAILALHVDPYNPNLPEQFDPKFVQYGPNPELIHPGDPFWSGVLAPYRFGGQTFTFEDVIAEGDLISVRVSWVLSTRLPSGEPSETDIYQMGTYRIANGKIVEAWISLPFLPNS